MKLDSIKIATVKNYSSNTRIAYKNLEDYDKGIYKPDKKIAEKLKARMQIHEDKYD